MTSSITINEEKPLNKSLKSSDYCSFCGSTIGDNWPSEDVKWLAHGPKVQICDVCVSYITFKAQQLKYEKLVYQALTVEDNDQDLSEITAEKAIDCLTFEKGKADDK